FLLGCGRPQTSSKLMVGVSIQPLAFITQAIGGDHVEVFTVVPPGANPHTFELNPALMQKLSRADLLVVNGIGLEYWLENVRGVLGNKPVVVASEGLDIRIDEEEEGHTHNHPAGNPHVWLDPVYAGRQAQRIAEALIRLDGSNRALYEANLASFQQELKALDDEIRSRIEKWPQRRFVCFHPSWVYFAARYGLEQAAVIEKRPGQEQSPQEIAELIRIIGEIRAKAMFAEAQFPSAVAQVIADETGARVITLDPLGSSPQINSYPSLIRYNVAQMETAMGPDR
ncbi:MAG: metal ABC transporter substrate-binding protein, partial [candidate division KSB1 bacterium]|nr:metal ABC transporter substrate-binding protein [candidate division KSB1 bacterium]